MPGSVEEIGLWLVVLSLVKRTRPLVCIKKGRHLGYPLAAELSSLLPRSRIPLTALTILKSMETGCSDPIPQRPGRASDTIDLPTNSSSTVTTTATLTLPIDDTPAGTSG